MFKSFFLRCYRSFSRNLIVSLLPLAMPAIFLLLFLDATGNAGTAPTLRVGLAEAAASSPLTEALIETGVVSVDETSVGDDHITIDARRFDAILTGGGQGRQPTMFVRPGFEPWARVVLAEAARSSDGQSGNVQIPVRTVESGNGGYLPFILPGLFVMVLIQLAITSTASVVLNDRADGTFRMVSSVRGALGPLISAEISFRLLFALSCYAFMMVVISQAAGDWLGGRLLTFTGVFLLGATMMIALGYTLGGLLPGRRNWSAVITLIGLAFWFFSDILFQASQHALARPLSLILPPTYITDALRQISTQQPGTFPLAVDVGMISLFLIAFIALGLRFFKFETNDDRM